MTLGQFIRKYRFEHDLKQTELSEMCEGISPSYISMLERGYNSKTGKPIEVTPRTFNKIAAGIGMSPSELSKLIDDSPYASMDKGEEKQEQREVQVPKNVKPLSQMMRHKIPLIGYVAGGKPIYDEEVDLFLDGPSKATCAVRLRGDSMEPTYKSGDIIYRREQPDVYDGQVAVVSMDGEASLKRVYHIKDGLQLLSENPKYPPMICTYEEYNNIRIIGIPVGYTRMYES